MTFTRHTTAGLLGALVVVGTAAACVETPFERSNVADPESTARVVLSGVPDSLHSRSASFGVAALISGGQLPRKIAGLTIRADGAPFQQLVVQTGSNEFQVGADASLIPREVIVYAIVAPSSSRRLAERRVIVWQRPRSAEVACQVVGCTSMTGVGATTTLTLTLRDSLATNVNFGSAATRYGDFSSRDPGVVEVVDRPQPNTVRVRSVAAGTAWIVFTGGGFADSLQFTVAP